MKEHIKQDSALYTTLQNEAARVIRQNEHTQAHRNLDSQDPSLATPGMHSLPPGGGTSAMTTKVTAREREDEETLTQLQIEYNALLRRHAEAENTIDELRLGAKVSLYSDSPTPQQGQMGSLAAPHHAQTLSIGRMGAGSLVAPSGSHGYISSVVSEYNLYRSSYTSITSGRFDLGKHEYTSAVRLYVSNEGAYGQAFILVPFQRLFSAVDSECHRNVLVISVTYEARRSCCMPNAMGGHCLFWWRIT